MGLTKNAMGTGTIDSGLVIKKHHVSDKVIALAGNPNVGKSTVFNELTGLKQHTGNWPGKTVTNAQGYCRYEANGYILVDLPGTYSLAAHSAEEEAARDFICFEEPDAVVVVCDATCLERNLNLVLQILEITSKVVVCVNLIDEAQKKKIDIDINGLSEKLGIPVVATAARSKDGLDRLMHAIDSLFKDNTADFDHPIYYPDYIEDGISSLQSTVDSLCPNTINPRWLSLKLLENDDLTICSVNQHLHINILEENEITQDLAKIHDRLAKLLIPSQKLKDDIVACLVTNAEGICRKIITCQNKSYHARDRKIDRLLTNKWTGFPLMLLLLLLIFWITISGANYPSQLISNSLFHVEKYLLSFFQWLHVPNLICQVLVFGVYRVLAWVVSVMLPPMAIFFPLFTLLEDVGYLPRVAFNLDKCYKKCNACGKQALTMCMGFGCNAAGVIGCRIIDSRRERLIAIITNSFVPCNGRFPTLIALITMFFIGLNGGLSQSLLSAGILTLFIAFGILLTFFVSKLLSETVLKGVPSSFTLELPPYRRPQICKVLLHSIFDRTLFVLGRAIIVAAPAGLLIWIIANVRIGNLTILNYCSGFLDPFARLLGMDGVILMAFILGIPANEIVLPIIIMAYMSSGTLTDISDLTVLKQLFVANGWTWITAVSVMLFSLVHWPCSTTCMTIKKETQSIKWTLVSFLLPTVLGMLICFLFNSIARLL